MANTPDSLSPGVQAEVRQAIAWSWTSSKDEPKDVTATLERAGVPTKGRVLVVVGFQGCTTHNFEELLKTAAAKNATLYVINALPSTPDPGIRINGKELHVATKLTSPRDIREAATELGLSARIDESGTFPVVISTRSQLIEDGKTVIEVKTKPLSSREPSPAIYRA